MTFSLRELRELSPRGFAPEGWFVLLRPEARDALVEAVEAARAVRKRHPANAESADLVLDRALARFTDQETT